MEPQRAKAKMAAQKAVLKAVLKEKARMEAQPWLPPQQVGGPKELEPNQRVHANSGCPKGAATKEEIAQCSTTRNSSPLTGAETAVALDIGDVSASDPNPIRQLQWQVRMEEREARQRVKGRARTVEKMVQLRARGRERMASHPNPKSLPWQRKNPRPSQPKVHQP
jgi:hypothetical protein